MRQDDLRGSDVLRVGSKTRDGGGLGNGCPETIVGRGARNPFEGFSVVGSAGKVGVDKCDCFGARQPKLHEGRRLEARIATTFDNLKDVPRNFRDQCRARFRVEDEPRNHVFDTDGAIDAVRLVTRHLLD